MTLRPYRIDVSEDLLTDLRRRLGATRWPEPLPGKAWERGSPVSYVRQLCDYWRREYDWRRHEAALNAFPQYLCEVDGVDLHFWRVRGQGPSPTPLLLVHGWPGSIYEFFHLIEPLTNPAAHGGRPEDAFDVVIPALPGYGFGGKPRDEGWDPQRIAAAFNTLMVQHLGYRRYGAQGGDWGSFVCTELGLRHGEHLLGLHLNMAMAAPPPGEENSAEAQAFYKRLSWMQKHEGGYSHEQGTKPESLMMAQSDSPAGLAAWIVEKFRTWSDCDGNVESLFSKDWLITNLMFYWAPHSIASAANLYHEAHISTEPPSQDTLVRVPTAVAAFPKEIYQSPRSWLARRFNLQRYTPMPRGGHFASVEQPELFLDDVRAFFRSVRHP